MLTLLFEKGPLEEGFSVEGTEWAGARVKLGVVVVVVEEPPLVLPPLVPPPLVPPPLVLLVSFVSFVLFELFELLFVLWWW